MNRVKHSTVYISVSSAFFFLFQIDEGKDPGAYESKHTQKRPLVDVLQSSCS